MSNHHIPIADYTLQTSICQTFIAQNPHKFLAIFVGFCEKKYKKVWIILENQEKRFDNVMVCYWLVILGELVYLLIPFGVPRLPITDYISRQAWGGE
jgi:ABC-type tungstate transport system substrate-binding protein